MEYSGQSTPALQETCFNSTACLAALKRFEPVVHYTRGERFFPSDVERYVKKCSLWVQEPKKAPILLVPDGELTIEKLIQPRRAPYNSIYFLRLIEPLDLLLLTRFQLDQVVKRFTGKSAEEVFHFGPGRLARVGLLSRLLGAIFSLTLFLRGRIPGDAAAAAILTYQEVQKDSQQYTYYGRVVRQNGWVVLQYWYFYFFNNWRSGFFGVNDHESDWEMVTIYCSEGAVPPGGSPESSLKPEWIAYAAHDFAGDDLRRRWDDPEVKKIGEHPVIYAGVGSHASYFSSGEYMAEFEVPFLKPVMRILDWVGDFLRTSLHLGSSGEEKKPMGNVLRVPFVDYARGDGLKIGAGADHAWDARLLDNNTRWAWDYRGLWGLYANDPISGENAPAGPVYNRDGTVRRAWYDPLGWAGLDKVLPPQKALEVTRKQFADLMEQQERLNAKITTKSIDLAELGVELEAIQDRPHLKVYASDLDAKIKSLSKELGGLRSSLTVLEARLAALEEHAADLERGERGDMRAHIKRAAIPNSSADLKLSRMAEGFAAVSIGFVMIAMVLLVILARQYALGGLVAMFLLLVIIEAGFRHRLAQVITSLVVGLAIVCTGILLWRFFWWILGGAILFAGVYIIWQNVREIRS